MTAIESRLADVEQSLSILTGVVETLAENITQLQIEEEKDSGPRPWALPNLPDNIDTDLGVWVTWFNTAMKPTQRALHIPACWAQHGGLHAELLTLWHTWCSAFLKKGATPDSAQNWHDRWLPGFQTRVKTWVNSPCLTGDHKD